MSEKAVATHHTFPNLRSEIYLYGSHTACVPRGWTTQRHLHHMMFEINLVLDGCQTVVVNSLSHNQKSGDLVLISPMELHELKAARSDMMRYFVMHVQIADPIFLQLLMKSGLNLIESGHPLNYTLQPLVLNLMELLDLGSGQIPVLYKLFEIMNSIEQYCSNKRSQHASLPEDELSYQIAREIEKLLLQRDDEGEDALGNWMESIAARLGISRRHCYRVFSEAYRMSPRDYLSVLRQQEAMQALLNSGDSVEEIAHRIGFSNVQSFIRQFTKWTGMTPGVFRKKERDTPIYLTSLEEK